MRKVVGSLVILIGIGIHGVAMANNALTTEQLMKSLQASLKDYETMEPDMAASISGLRTTTLGKNAQVVIEMNADGMKMTAKYLCVPQGQDMACNFQQ